MAALLRLLLAICLVATAVPAPLAHAAADDPHAVVADHDAGGPPCHGAESPEPSDAAVPDSAHGCCADGVACEGGCDCGCLHATGLPMSGPPAAAGTLPPGRPAGAMHSVAPPRLSPPVRPPIA